MNSKKCGQIFCAHISPIFSCWATELEYILYFNCFVDSNISWHSCLYSIFKRDGGDLPSAAQSYEWPLTSSTHFNQLQGGQKIQLKLSSTDSIKKELFLGNVHLLHAWLHNYYLHWIWQWWLSV